MNYAAASQRMPAFLRRWILHFEAEIEDAVAAFAQRLPDGARVLDAGAGELRYAGSFKRHRYTSADLAIGDPAWDYGKLDCIADLTRLPFASGGFAACVNIVTLEHVREPAAVMRN